MRSLARWVLPADPTQPLESATRRYVDAVSIGWAGQVTGTWTPDWTLARQIKAQVTGAVTIATPSNANGTPPDGYVASLWVWTTTGSQTVTLDAGLGIMGGFPSSFQLVNNKLAEVILRYTSDFTRWTVLLVAQEQ